MEGDMSEIATLLPQWLLDVETQAVIIVGLSFVGAWVILTWLLQIIFSVLWPFFAVTALMILLPSLRKVIATEFIPKHVEAVKTWAFRLASGFNTTSHN